jgi:ACS family tartrate transporter-like MFS transporter
MPAAMMPQLTMMYPRSDRARAMSMFYIGAALASVIGLPLSGSLLNMEPARFGR